jgi:hypothetical protein
LLASEARKNQIVFLHQRAVDPSSLSYQYEEIGPPMKFKPLKDGSVRVGSSGHAAEDDINKRIL